MELLGNMEPCSMTRCHIWHVKQSIIKYETYCNRRLIVAPLGDGFFRMKSQEQQVRMPWSSLVAVNWNSPSCQCLWLNWADMQYPFELICRKITALLLVFWVLVNILKSAWALLCNYFKIGIWNITFFDLSFKIFCIVPSYWPAIRKSAENTNINVHIVYRAMLHSTKGIMIVL